MTQLWFSKYNLINKLIVVYITLICMEYVHPHTKTPYEKTEQEQQ